MLCCFASYLLCYRELHNLHYTTWHYIELHCMTFDPKLSILNVNAMQQSRKSEVPKPSIFHKPHSRGLFPVASMSSHAHSFPLYLQIHNTTNHHK